MNDGKLIFEKSSPGQAGYSLPPLDVPEEKLEKLIPAELRREELNLPELSELDVVRHFTRLSQKNFSVDSHFYPLGSCTMKYNPKVNEEAAHLPGFVAVHPLQDGAEVQGMLELLYNFERYLCAIFGYEAFTLQPAAGAHGELTSLMMIKAYHKEKVESRKLKAVPAGRQVESRTQEARKIARSHLATAMIDSSDGLVRSVIEICRASKVGARIQPGSVPIAKGATLDQALYGGEEYELVFTAPRAKAQKLARLVGGVSVVGEIVSKKQGVKLIDARGKVFSLKSGGYEHFK